MKKYRVLALVLAALMVLVPLAVSAQTGWTLVSNELLTPHAILVSLAELQFPVTLAWSDAYTLPTNVKVGQTFTMGVTATSPLAADGGWDVERAVFFMSVVKNETEVATDADVTLVASDGQALSFDSDTSLWRWGPSGGFPLTMGWDETTDVNVTFLKPGTYTARIFCVQLAEDGE